jgi:hypothetical protein
MIEIVHGAAMLQGRQIAAVRPLRLLSEMVSDSVFQWLGQMPLHSAKEKPSRSAMAIANVKATPWANERAFLSPWVNERAKESAFLSFSLWIFCDVSLGSALGARKIF